MLPHFAFGKNWQNYLKKITPERIEEAKNSIVDATGKVDLSGQKFLDIGCGSGLFSLCATRLGAEVVSFDYDADSVECARELKRIHAPDADRWEIMQGSALDREFLQHLGQFDVVYSWGVLHHTGEMWNAIDCILASVAPKGLLIISIYNDQGQTSNRWKKVKKLYQKLPGIGQRLLVFSIQCFWSFKRIFATTASSFVRLLTLRNPLLPIKLYIQDSRLSVERGMDKKTDLVDWVGGWPFEVAKPEEVFNFVKKHGYQLEKLKTCGGGQGCNEYVFKKI